MRFPKKCQQDLEISKEVFPSIVFILWVVFCIMIFCFEIPPTSAKKTIHFPIKIYLFNNSIYLNTNKTVVIKDLGEIVLLIKEKNPKFKNFIWMICAVWFIAKRKQWLTTYENLTDFWSAYFVGIARRVIEKQCADLKRI